MEKLINSWLTQPQQPTKPQGDILQKRLSKVSRIAKLMREEHNHEKAIQAYRLINIIQSRLASRTRLNIPHIN